MRDVLYGLNDAGLVVGAVLLVLCVYIAFDKDPRTKP